MAEDSSSDSGDTGGSYSADVSSSLPTYGDGTYGGATNNGPNSISGTYGLIGGGGSSSPTWASVAAGYQSVADSYASMGPLPSSHFQYGGFGSKAGSSLDEAMGISGTPSSSGGTTVDSLPASAGGGTMSSGSKMQSKASRGGGGGMGGGSFKVSPEAEYWLKKHIGEDWYSRSYGKGHMPMPQKPGGGADFEKIGELGRQEIAAVKRAAIQNARNETVKQVMGTLPAASPREVSPTSPLHKSDTTTPADSMHKASYWKEFYSLPPEARGYLQPGMKKAYVDIMEKALKSAGL